MGFTTTVWSQTLYQTIYEKARTEAAASQGNERTVNQYKLKALDYIATQAKKDGRFSDNRFMDMQAVNLESFIQDFLSYKDEAARISQAKAEEVVRCYTTASFSHQLFKNESPLVDGGAGALLPFSLNTDWESAYDQATTVVKQVLKK